MQCLLLALGRYCCPSSCRRAEVGLGRAGAAAGPGITTSLCPSLPQPGSSCLLVYAWAQHQCSAESQPTGSGCQEMQLV